MVSAELAEIIKPVNYLRPNRAWRCGERVYTLGARTWVMAIVNLTPDSFYAASRMAPGEPKAVVKHCLDAIEAGADILDLGAESTRPGSSPLSPEQEQARLLPALEAVRRALPEALLSVDTRHAITAAAALDSGADIINDVSGGADPEMRARLARSQCGVVLMHTRGEFATMQKLPPLEDPLATVETGLAAIAERAHAAGIDRERAMLDPGFGFGKNLDENFPVLAGLDRLHGLGHGLLVGVSRKSFLRSSRDSGPEMRLPASLAAATAAALAGAHVLRVHDVAATVDAARVADRLLVTLRRAATRDVEAIAALLAANTHVQGGELTGTFPVERVAAWVASSFPVLVAEQAGRLLGVLVTSDPQAPGARVSAEMLAAYPARGGAYVYGPVCLTADARGRGIVVALYAELRRLLPGREAILFIREDNARSLRAHEKLGMRRVAGFHYDGAAFAVFSGRAGAQTVVK